MNQDEESYQEYSDEEISRWMDKMLKENRWEVPKSIRMFKVYTHMKWRKPRGIDPISGQTIRAETAPDYTGRTKNAASDIYFKSAKAAKFFVDNHKAMYFKSSSNKDKKIRYSDYPNKFYWIKEAQFLCNVEHYEEVINDDANTLWFTYWKDWTLNRILLDSLLEKNGREKS